MANPETLLQRDIVQAIEAMGLSVYRMNAGGYRGRAQLHPAGTPDLLVLLPLGSVVWIEVKNDDGRLSETQREAHEALARQGHSVHVVRSVDEALHACVVDSREKS